MIWNPQPKHDPYMKPLNQSLIWNPNPNMKPKYEALTLKWDPNPESKPYYETNLNLKP